MVILGTEERGNRLNFKEAWDYRELLLFLSWRDLKIRYKQTVLGMAWAVVQPVFSMVMMTVVFGKLAKIPADGLPYPVFNYAALVPWTFFVNSISRCSFSLVGNSHLITKVYFPRLIIPVASILPGLFDYAIAFSLMAPLMLYFGILPTWSVLYSVPLLTLNIMVLSLGLGLCLSSLNVKFRDVGNLIPFMIQLAMYATPIVYPLSLVPEKYRWLMMCNPMTGTVEGFRSALLGTPWNLTAICVSVAMSAFFLVIGLIFFTRVERSFTDVV